MAALVLTEIIHLELPEVMLLYEMEKTQLKQKKSKQK